MSRVFLDTVGLLAIWDKNDAWHAPASQAYQLLTSQRSHLFTTHFVLLECGNAAARRPYRNEPDNLRATLALINGLITPTEEDWETAWANYRKGGPGSAGIVDQVSFVVMRRMKFSSAFTNDQHFRTAGFTPLF